MNAALGAAPAGGPAWLNAVWVALAVLVAIFGRGFGTSILSAMRSMRAGIAVKESTARQQEREYRAEERAAAETGNVAAFARLTAQLEDADRRITALVAEVEGLREQVRHQYAHEQSTMAGLSAHAVWDLAVKPHLPEDFPYPPPLLPPRAVQHSSEWGPAQG